jgi:transcription elongation factor Elf1
MPEDFACPDCGSPSVVYVEADKDDGHVVCRRCGTFLMTRGQFRRFVEAPTLPF